MKHNGIGWFPVPLAQHFGSLYSFFFRTRKSILFIHWSRWGDSNTQGVSAPVSKTGLLPFTELHLETQICMFLAKIFIRQSGVSAF